jgi:hypothetical protein
MRVDDSNQRPGGATDDGKVGAFDRERRGWHELIAVVGVLTPEDVLEPGYYTDPDWCVRDVVAHIGTWLAEGQVQLERIGAGTYGRTEIDIDAVNAELLEGMKGEPWDVTWTQAQAARTVLLQVWRDLELHTDDAHWWIAKSGPDHYAEHLPRLRAWTDELVARRTRTT